VWGLHKIVETMWNHGNDDDNDEEEEEDNDRIVHSLKK